jgi:hypothetical protein
MPGVRPPDVAMGRLAGSGLLAWMGWIHLERWSEGYRHVPSIGDLFLVDFGAAVLIALAVIAAGPRFLPLAAAAGGLAAAATMAALEVSLHQRLFGFKESWHAPFVQLSVWVEAAAVVVLGVTAVRGWITRDRTPATKEGSPGRRPSPAGGTTPG